MSVQEEIKELRGKLTQRQDELARIFEEAGPDLDMDKVKSVPGTPEGKVEYIRQLNSELEDLRKKLDQKEELLRIASEAVKVQQEPERKEVGHKSIGELFVASPAYKRKGEVAHLDIDVKTLMQTSAGWTPESTRSDLVVPYATRPIQLSDLVPVINIDQAAYKYMEETTFTNNAAEVAEGGAYGEAALALTERTATVEKVAVWLPVTDEQLEEVSGIQDYINQRLSFMLRQKFDSQILNGSGTTPQLAGILNVTGVQTQAKGSYATPDAIYLGLKAVRVTGRAIPNAVVMHPDDWFELRTLKTGDGVYIWGNPAEVGPETIWGVRVVQTDAFTAAGTALVGDFANFSLCALRRGIDIQITNAHDDYFVYGKQAIRADFRCALVWPRPTAFCKVTGIVAGSS